MKKIAFTFAGRENMMSRQAVFMRRAVDLGHVDEWHIWNFARKDADRAWLEREFGEARVVLTENDSLNYVRFSAFESSRREIGVFAQNDAHLLFQLTSGECVEIVLGAFSNTRSLLRQFDNVGSYRQHAEPVEVSDLALKPGVENVVALAQENGAVSIHLNGEKLFVVMGFARADSDLLIHTGYGSHGIWRDASVQRNIKLIECGKGGFEGFGLAYAHYASNLYADNLFLKLDDDILYCDIDMLDDFFAEIARTRGGNIVSANVINNGVCAHYQAKHGYFPGLPLEFEYPAQGICGSLWESAPMCASLHDYFVDHLPQIKDKALSGPRLFDLPQFDRFSINFVGFKHVLFAYMQAAYLAAQPSMDDEHLMTRVVPRLFNVEKSVFAPLLVSHLSFWKQHETLDVEKVLARY
jgi:hypothetical protein